VAREEVNTENKTSEHIERDSRDMLTDCDDSRSQSPMIPATIENIKFDIKAEPCDTELTSLRPNMRMTRMKNLRKKTV